MPESLNFYGFRTPGLSDDQIIDAIERLEQYSILPYDGGQLDQPSQFWEDVDMYNAIYNFARNEAIKDMDKKRA